MGVRDCGALLGVPEGGCCLPDEWRPGQDRGLRGAGIGDGDEVVGSNSPRRHLASPGRNGVGLARPLLPSRLRIWECRGRDRPVGSGERLWPSGFRITVARRRRRRGASPAPSRVAAMGSQGACHAGRNGNRAAVMRSKRKA